MEKNSEYKFYVNAKFILKASNTGNNVRIGVKVKAEKVGEDSSGVFSPESFVVAVVSYATIGEIFEAIVELDGSGFEKNDAVALQVGRDGNNEMGSGDNDDASVAIQIISVKTEVGI